MNEIKYLKTAIFMNATSGDQWSPLHNNIDKEFFPHPKYKKIMTHKSVPLFKGFQAGVTLLRIVRP